jgi:hypothetical protein
MLACLLRLFFDHEVRGNTFLRNACKLIPGYIMSYPRRFPSHSRPRGTTNNHTLRYFNHVFVIQAFDLIYVTTGQRLETEFW